MDRSDGKVTLEPAWDGRTVYPLGQKSPLVTDETAEWVLFAVLADGPRRAVESVRETDERWLQVETPKMRRVYLQKLSSGVTCVMRVA